MHQLPVESVAFDLLLKGPAAASGRQPSVGEIEQFKPPPEAVERCRRWLAARAVTCHATDFGLACTAAPGRFTELFGVALEPAAAGPGLPALRMAGEPRPPEPIADLVDQVTLSAAPELF